MSKPHCLSVTVEMQETMAVGREGLKLVALQEIHDALAQRCALKTLKAMFAAWEKGEIQRCIANYAQNWNENKTAGNAEFDKDVAVEQAMKPAQAAGPALLYLIMSLPHCLTASLLHCLTVSLTDSLPCCCTVLPSYCRAVVSPHCPAAALAYCLTVLLLHRRVASPSYRLTASLPCCCSQQSPSRGEGSQQQPHTCCAEAHHDDHANVARLLPPQSNCRLDIQLTWV